MGNILDRERRIEQLKAKLKKEVSKKNRENRKRKKFIIGHVILNAMNDDNEFNEMINKILSKKVLHSKDRELFEFPILQNQRIIDHTKRRIYIV